MIRFLRIALADGNICEWNLTFSNEETLLLSHLIERSSFPWVDLEHFQCPDCSLNALENNNCPVAQALAKYAFDLTNYNSYDKVNVEVAVAGGGRKTMTDVPLQKVVGELVRLAFFQGNCSIGRDLKEAMSQLPLFPSDEDILQAFTYHFACVVRRMNKGSEEELVNQRQQYMRYLHNAFGSLCKRLRSAGDSDVYSNAVIIHHSLSLMFSLTAPELMDNAIKRFEMGESLTDLLSN